MTLVDRYLAAVKFWLPKAGREDIAAELAEDIRSQIEESEAGKGRPLSDDEIAAILKARGAPLTVASRYQPQRHLIGPEIFPVYAIVLKITAGLWLVPWLLLSMLAFFRHGTVPAAHLPFESLFTAFTIITIVFALIDRYGVASATGSKFDPQRLPAVVDHTRIKRCDAIADIIGVVFLFWLYQTGWLSSPEQTLAHGHVAFSPQWVVFWQIMIGFALIDAGFAAYALFHPAWTRTKVVLRLGLDLGKTATFGWLLSTHLLRSIGAENSGGAWLATSFSDQAADHALAVTAGFALVVVATAAVRLYRLQPKPAG
jgi:hypothetical protein